MRNFSDRVALTTCDALLETSSSWTSIPSKVFKVIRSVYLGYGHSIYVEVAVFVACGYVVLCWIYRHLQNDARRGNAILGRKKDFLARNFDVYGYQSSPKGYVDKWRPLEYPGLVLPLQWRRRRKSGPARREVYLDAAGAALPSTWLLRSISNCGMEQFPNGDQVVMPLANPHSTGPAAARTKAQIDETKRRLLEYLNAMPGRSSTGHAQEIHPGYEIIFTSGSTESLRVVAETFPVRPPCSSCGGGGSRLVYASNSHTSVLGMRGPFASRGGTFCAVSLDEISNEITNSPCLKCRCNAHATDRKNLLVFPVECNFGGERPDAQQIVENAHKENFLVLMDIAKAAATGPINLRQLNPDFACLSFYKIFGAPTGLGALLVKRSLARAFEHQGASIGNRYFGGGSVDMVLAKQNVVFPRSALPFASMIPPGTAHFRGIVSLNAGLDEVSALGGMMAIHRHTRCLAAEFVERIRNLSHGNGNSVVRIYGGWESKNEQLFPGPIVSFNIMRSDKSYVGYNEVAKLAALQQPSIQFRTGCFCNPGGCQEALRLSDEDIIRNYERNGHVCGDHIDLVDGKPTGAVRVSFGKESIWEDLDAMVTFIESHFVDESPCNLSSVPMEKRSSSVELADIYIYPIKSCSAQAVSRWELRPSGGRLLYDREFALVDPSGIVLRLQDYPKMTTIRPVIDLKLRTLRVSAPNMPDIQIALDDTPHENQKHRPDVVRVCGDECGAQLFGSHTVSEWFSRVLGVQCWLARHYDAGDDGNPQLVPPSRQVAFANEKPMLMVSQEAVSVLNAALAKEGKPTVSPTQFRPNLVVRSSLKGALRGTIHEDDLERLDVVNGDLRFNVAGNCARCAMVDYDPISGRKGEVLRTLAKFRRRNGQIVFGLFLEVTRNDLQAISTQRRLEKGTILNCKYRN